MNQQRMPLFHALQQFSVNRPISFHVPGHKNGNIFPEAVKQYFHTLLKFDMTELTGLDDLHAPETVIADAEQLAADFFQTKKTFFLVGGSTAGNLAMILATCKASDKVIVQRNVHKSIMNGLELCGASPVFIAPDYNEAVHRYNNPNINTLKRAIEQHPNAKAVVLTYPDYFGHTFALKKMIELAHSHRIPVLIDEAHGVHFSLGSPMPPSAIKLGADIVVQSAHKMAPAMTMGSYLHMNSRYVSERQVAHYLQMIQSSSPSYPLMASLDIARAFLANMPPKAIHAILDSVDKVKGALSQTNYWSIVTADDPLKITLEMQEGITATQVASYFEEQQIYPELATHNQLLFIHGLAPFTEVNRLKKAVKTVNDQLKNTARHDTIDIQGLFTEKVQELALSYQTMDQLQTNYFSLQDAVGYVAAESVIPYPPGIALILKGEVITTTHINTLFLLREQGVRMQHRYTEDIQVFINIGLEEGEEGS
ncbi:aminotransferase class I/II-fold pyridoxal phosphate-dependent enzyme [Virgibacillus salexigens]|uniref:aminotransferase class I/II-fold pyridoxal phosphate-dependent enzyme n=1 Tax=Virgibacillus salexigens TaxID=61016 RepID=UPI00190D5246|nr:aminotransferase class I/II-fold pyridoxal phosphate-dependent enzyme [Virgibacillus salexigens]